MGWNEMKLISLYNNHWLLFAQGPLDGSIKEESAHSEGDKSSHKRVIPKPCKELKIITACPFHCIPCLNYGSEE